MPRHATVVVNVQQFEAAAKKLERAAVKAAELDAAEWDGQDWDTQYMVESMTFEENAGTHGAAVVERIERISHAEYAGRLEFDSAVQNMRHGYHGRYPMTPAEGLMFRAQIAYVNALDEALRKRGFKPDAERENED